jgi:hypothetical protein
VRLQRDGHGLGLLLNHWPTFLAKTRQELIFRDFEVCRYGFPDGSTFVRAL